MREENVDIMDAFFISWDILIENGNIMLSLNKIN